MTDQPHNLTPADWETAERVLHAVLKDPTLADSRPEFRTLVAGVNRLGRKHSRQQEAAAQPVPETEFQPRPCYMCRQKFSVPDPENPLLCVPCGQLGAEKRAARADLTGRVAVLTGGRIKIGYATSLQLLRDGATTIVTTRFPADALRRYQAEPDAQEWLGRLHLYGLDLRDMRGVEAFCEYLHATQPHLDILINNAAQTIARPMHFYAHLLEGERLALPSSGEAATVAQAAPLQWLKQENDGLEHYFPAGQLDEFGEQLDLRPDNSWTLKLDQIEAREWLEVQLVNVAAPSLLCRALLPLLRQSPFARRFIVDLLRKSAGKF